MAEHVQPMLSSYLDDEVDHSQRRQIETHLRECPQCRQYLEDLRELSNEIKFAYAFEPVPGALERTVMDQIDTQPNGDGATVVPKLLISAACLLLFAALIIQLSPAVVFGATLASTMLSIGYSLLHAVPILMSSVPYLLWIVLLVAVGVIVLSVWSLRYLLAARTISQEASR